MAISKHGLEKFHFCIYEYFTYYNKANSSKWLTDLETMYIKKWEFSYLYNFLRNAFCSEGYKHTESAKQKRVERLKDKSNNPFWGKHQYDVAKSLISKPVALNPMFGKSHPEETKSLIRSKVVKYINGVGIYDLDNHLIKSFDYASNLATYLNVFKVTVSKYISKGFIFQDKYYFKVNLSK